MLTNKLKKFFERHPALPKIMANINWLTVEKIFNMMISLFIGVWVARYLGPDKYGVMNYAVAFVALFSPLSRLGLDSIVVRNIVQNPEKKDEYLGTTLVLKFGGSVALFGLVLFLITFFKTDHPKTQLYVLIIAFGYIFKSIDTINLWFQSQIQSKYTVFSRSGSLFLVSLLKIAFILTHSPLTAFIWAITIDTIMTAVFLFFFYQAKGFLSLFHWKIKIPVVKDLLKDSWPLILSSIAIIIYMRIDQVMLGTMLNSSALGIYSAAVKISEKWYFIPTIISLSVFPSIINTKKKSEGKYLDRLQKLYDFFTWFSICFALLITLFSKSIILFLYGQDYSQASSVLSVHIWAGVFVFLGIASRRYLIIENATKITFFRTFSGALSNVILNVILIPIYGIMGAAYATLVSYAISGYFSNILFKKSRKIFIMFLKSLFPIHYLKK